MKPIKLFLYMSVIISFTIMMLLGTGYGASVTMQREAAPQKAQENAVVKKDMNVEGNQLKFAPRRLKGKNDSGTESERGDRPVNIQRYKPFKDGEGERKMR
jgi:hypothetical protein